jgi:translin
LIEDLVKRVVTELRAREKARDEVLSRARRARMLSKQAILLVHNGALGEAKAKIDEARRLREEVGPYVAEYVDLAGYEEVHAAEEEYAEASILYKLKTSGSFPAPEDIGVSLQAYVLGSGDVIGELKREAVDAMRVGDPKAAEAELALMERIYLDLLSMEEASLLLKGLRRKLDVARAVIESTRGELTTETGRLRLIESMDALSVKLDDAKTREPTRTKKAKKERA